MRNFSKQQLILMADSIMSATMDQISRLVPPAKRWVKASDEILDWCEAVSSVSLENLYNRITNESMTDAEQEWFTGPHSGGWIDFIETFVANCCQHGGRKLDSPANAGQLYPSTREFAVEFVNKMFENYLKGIPADVVTVQAGIGVVDTYHTNAFDVEDEFVNACCRKDMGVGGGETQFYLFDCQVCEWADNGEDFTVDLAMRVTEGHFESVNYNGTEGQDRKSYSDNQDRDSYTVDPELDSENYIEIRIG